MRVSGEAGLSGGIGTAWCGRDAWRFWTRGLLFAAIALAPGTSSAQAVDCAALRARIDAGGLAADAGQADLAMRQNRAELDRVRAYAQDSGCSGGSPFDDPDSPECHALLGREQQLRQTIDRLGAEGQPGIGGEERRAAIEDYDASCTGSGPEAALPPADAVVPVDPDAPPAAAPAPPDRVVRVYCVRHCDGAFYPLAVDVPKDKVGGLDQLCQAQCPNAESSVFSDMGGDVAKAVANDGSTYDALPTAFRFEKETSPTCSCRGPGRSWAETLAKAETMIEAQRGDVTVTPEVQARLETPLPPPDRKPGAAKPATARPAVKRAKAQPARSPSPAGADAGQPNPGEELTRAFRRSAQPL